jgi:hypothetical protein
MSSLNLNSYTPQMSAGEPLPAEQLQKAQSVKNLGIFAVILAILGIFVPFVLDIAALLLARRAMKISRDHLIPIEYEKAAYWAYRVSIAGIIWWVIIVFKVLT